MKKTNVSFMLLFILLQSVPNSSNLEFLKNNPYVFLKELAHCFNDSNFTKTKLNKVSFAYDEKKEKHLYFEYSNDKGYVLINKNKEIIALKEKGTLRLNEKNIFNSIQLEDVYTYDGNKQISYSSSNTFFEKIEYNELNEKLAKYSSNITLLDEGRLHGLPSNCSNEGLSQYEESVFVTTDSNASEGNCGIVSISNIFNYNSRHKDKNSLPRFDSKTTVKPYEETPSIYQKAFEDNYVPKSNEVEISTITYHVRKHAIEKGYVASGMDDEKTLYSFISTASDFGYSNSTFVTPSSFSFSDIKTEIDNNNPLQFRTVNDTVYGGHGMMVTGYKTFKYRKNYNMMISYVTLNCISVFDGHSKSERWYDISLGPIRVTGVSPRAEAISIAKTIVA